RALIVRGVLEGRAKGLDPRRLCLAALAAHLGERALDLGNLAFGEPEGRLGDDLPRPQIRSTEGETELPGLATFDALGAAHAHPLEHPAKLAAVGVRVHLHGAADRT